MPNTIFMALQCCQCSMMQVKQKKKSGNKWTCVVCNQKQSVRKVFAQGFMAKDLRGFVQSFNISRSREPDQASVGDGFEAEIEEEMANKKLKLNKYQTTADGKGYGVAGDDELPTTSFDSPGHGQVVDGEARASSTSKRSSLLAQDDNEAITKAASKWSNYMTQKGEESTPKKINVVSKWSSYMTQDDVERTSSQATMATSALKWRDMKPPRTEQPTKTKAAPTRVNRSTSNWCKYKTDDQDQRPHLPTRVGKAGSKWDNYLTQGEDGLERVNGRKTADHIGDWSNSVFKTTTDDQKVEDDIHPDFI